MRRRRTIFRIALVLCWFFLTYFFYIDYVTDRSYVKQKIGLSVAITLLVVAYSYIGKIKNERLKIKD